METNTLELLGAALGLGALSGLSLYLTVFVVGMCLDLDWIALRPGLEPIAALGNPLIWGTALVFYVVEFFADKVPWLDSIWDSVHTLIRPIGATFVAATALGQSHPSMEIFGALLAGSAALATHSAKAGARLVINTSPEPFSNIAASLFEDVVVVAGSFLALNHPLMTLFITVTGLSTFLYFLPSLFRMLKAQFHLVLGKIGSASLSVQEGHLPVALPVELDLALQRLVTKDERTRWAAPCLSGAFPDVSRNLPGFLVGTTDQHRVYFVARKGFKTIGIPISLRDAKADLSEHFLYDGLAIYRREEGVLARFKFAKKYSTLTKRILREIGLEPNPDSMALLTQEAVPA